MAELAKGGETVTDHIIVSMVSTTELLNMFPQFKPAWKSTTDKNVRYTLRQGMLGILTEIDRLPARQRELTLEQYQQDANRSMGG